jgi:hypothetical protein
MTIFVYLRSGLPESQGSKMASMTGKGIDLAAANLRAYISYLYRAIGHAAPLPDSFYPRGRS